MRDKFFAGQTYRARFSIDSNTVERFAEFSGDRNPIHLDSKEAESYGYPRTVAHGSILVAFLSKMIGTEIPGPGAIWMGQSLEWVHPVFVGDEIEIIVTVEEVSKAAGILCLDTVATNQKGKTVMKGKAKVKMAEKVTKPNPGTGESRKVALVTGGSRGIGTAIARRLASSGMAIAVNYRESHKAAEQVVQEIRSTGGSALAFKADMGDPVARSDMVHEVIGSFGRLDVVVHGASPSIRPVNIRELRYEDLGPFLKIYLEGALCLVATALPGMLERSFGRFIFLGTSYLFGAPPAGLAPYVTVKHALWGLVKSMAIELGSAGVTTNMVSPGMTITDLTADISARLKEVEARKNPMRRLATSQDTADLVAFLASESAGYINGANFPVTGGPL